MADAKTLKHAQSDRQSEAQERFGRLHGALELKAALLALLLPLGSRRAARAFELETEDIRPADSLRLYAESLPGPSRLPWFEALLPRMALQPLPLRQELLQATRRIMGARGGARPIDRLHWLTMRRGLGEPLAAQPRGSGTVDVSEWLETDLLAIASYSAFLSRMVPIEAPTPEVPGPGVAWYATVMEPWQWGNELPPCDPPNGEGAIRALNTLQTLSMMQRPMLIRGWIAATVEHSSPRWSDSAADALRMTCALLDTPMPPELARHFNAIDAKTK